MDQEYVHLKPTRDGAIKFVKNMLTPSINDTNKEFIDNINETVNIKPTQMGFEAEISDLDLSFLNDL